MWGKGLRVVGKGGKVKCRKEGRFKGGGKRGKVKGRGKNV